MEEYEEESHFTVLIPSSRVFGQNFYGLGTLVPVFPVLIPSSRVFGQNLSQI